jgi:ribonuclease P protein component
VYLDVRLAASPLRHSRIGFIVPKYGHSAVLRNRLKRHLREHARQELLGPLRALEPAAAGDIVLRAKPEAYGASLDALHSDVATLGTSIPRLVAELVIRAAPDTPARRDS